MKTITFEIPDTFPVGGRGFESALDVSGFAGPVLSGLLAYGVKQASTDSTSQVPADMARDAWVAERVGKGMDKEVAEKGWKDLASDARKSWVAAWTEKNADAVTAGKATAMQKRIDAWTRGEWEVRTAAAGLTVEEDVLTCLIKVRKEKGNPFVFEKGLPTAKRWAQVEAAFLALDSKVQDALRAQVAKERAERESLGALLV